MAQLQIFEQRDFSGGLNLRSDQFQLGDNESPSMLNVEIDPRGGIFSRGAMMRINTTDVTATWNPQKLYAFNSDSRRILLTTATNVWKSSGSDFTKLQYDNSGTPTDIVSDSSHGSCISFWGKTALITSGVNSSIGDTYTWISGDATATKLPRTNAGAGGTLGWAIDAASNVSNVPQSEHIVVHANKVFIGQTKENSTVHKNRIRWSLEGLTNKWREEDYIDILAGGEGITGMIPVQGQLVIFKPSAVYLLVGYDSDTFNIVELTSHIGCADHHSMAASETGVYFWSNTNGLYYYDGSSLKDIFQPLRPLLDFNKINIVSSEKISVSWVGKRLWLSLPIADSATPTLPTVNYVYDPFLGSYTQFQTADGYGVIGGCNFIDAVSNEVRLMIHPVEPCILSVDNYGVSNDSISAIDATQPFNSYYRTKWHDAGSYMQRKFFRRPDFVMKESSDDQDVTVSVFHDYNENTTKRTFTLSQNSVSQFQWDDPSSVWDTAKWAAGAISSAVLTGRNLGLAKTIQLQFNGPSGKEWGINSIGFKFVPKRIKG